MTALKDGVCVIEFEVLHCRHNEEIVKEVSVAAENVIETFHFKSPYPMMAQGSEENGLSWSDGQLVYDKLRKAICEAVSGYAHLYAYGVAKTKFLTTLLAQPVRNLEDFKSPPPHGLKAQFSCSMQCPQELSKLPLRNTKRAHTIQMAQASPSFPLLYQLSSRLYTPYRFVYFGCIAAVMTSF